MNIHKRFRTIYSECSIILEKIVNKKITLRNEIYSHKKPSSYIPILEKALQNYELLNNIITKTDFYKKNVFYSLILCSEILTGRIKNKFWLAKFETIKQNEDIKHVKKQKYIRINTLKGKLDDLKDFSIEKTFIPNVYKLKNVVNFSKCEAYKAGKYAVQNVASCLPSFILNPEPNSQIIDACAAPGNKTSHIADIVKNKGKIVAVEVDVKRYKTLNYQLKKLGITNVQTVNDDFLNIDPANYRKTDYVLVDPTCSGSGIHDLYEKDDSRILNLHKFQVKILKHAMQFEAKKIVYSTCSCHKEECEDVVYASIKDSNYEVFDLAKMFSDISYEGIEVSDKFVRCTASDECSTVGFFIALLIRK